MCAENHHVPAVRQASTPQEGRTWAHSPNQLLSCVCVSGGRTGHFSVLISELLYTDLELS